MKKIFLLFTVLSLTVAHNSFSQNIDIVMGDVAIGGDGSHIVSNTCGATIYDSGGTGAGGPYTNNESDTLILCPDTPGDIMSIIWTIFDLDPTDLNPNPNASDADNITVYNADFVDPANTLGTYSSGQIGVGDVFTANPGLNPANPNGCLTIVFQSNAANTTNPAPNYAFTASCSTPCDPPLADGMMLNADNAAGDSIAICVGDTVTFQDNGSTPAMGFNLVQWIWHWSDNTDNDTTASGGQIQHVFNAPGEYVIQLEVVDDNGCSNLNATDIRVYVTTYPTFDPFPNDTTLCVGEQVVFNAFPDAYEVLWSGFPLSVQDDDNCMEDNVGAIVQTPMLITGYDPNIALDNANPDVLSICVDIEHSFIGDFVLQVQCPTGQIMTLHQQGGGGVNLGDPEQGGIDCTDLTTFGTPWSYCFEATAAETWVDAVANGNTVPNATGGNSIPAGNYLPVDPLGFAALDGCPINGQWNLLFTDLWGGDDGSIPGWSINFDPALNPPVTQFQPDIGTGADSSFWDLTDPNIIANTPDLNSITVEAVTGGVFQYNYTVVNSFGCAFDSTVTVTVDSNMFVSAGPDTTVCFGVPVNIGPGSANGGSTCDYTLVLADSWGDGWNGNSIDITTSAGTTNYTGPATDSVTINVPVTHGETITIQFNSVGGFSASQCSIFMYAGDGTLVYSDGTNGTTPTPLPQNVVVDCFLGYVFDWTPTTNLTLPSDVNPSVNPTTQTTYTLTTHPVGHPDCIVQDSVVVSVSVFIDPGTDSTVTFCKEGVTEDLFNYLGGTPMTTGDWFDPNGDPINMPIDPAVAIDGAYEYMIDSSGCTRSAFVDVTIIEVVLTPVITNATCHTICDGQIQVNATNAVTYSADNGVTFQPGDIFTGLCDGDYDIVAQSAMVSNGTVCSADTLLTVTEPPAIDITNISPADTLCLGESSSITVQSIGGSNGIYDYAWDNGIIANSQMVTHSPPQSTTVCVVVSDADCPLSPTADSCMTLTIPAAIEVEVPEFFDGCYPLGFTLENTSSSLDNVTALNPRDDVETATWTFTDGVTYVTNGNESVSHDIPEHGDYGVTLTVVSEQGCEFSQTYPVGSILVHNHPDAAFNFTPGTLDIFNTTAQFYDLSEGNPAIKTWNWTFAGGATPSSSNESDPIVKYPEGIPGTFNVDLVVTNTFDCVDEVSNTITILNEINIFAPNVFTPDGDEFNNSWRVYISGIDVYDFHLVIFNRWGEKVFESFDSNAEWNGTFGNTGDVVIEGSYVWIIEAKDIKNDNRYEFNGTISILK